MHWTNLDDVRSTLDSTVLGRLCVSAWLGFAAVLFIGFGDRVIDAEGKHHPVPPAELETGFTDWWIEDSVDVIGRSTDARAIAVAAAKRLVGCEVTAIEFVEDSVALEITFDNGLVFKMAPYQDGDVSERCAWCLRAQGHCCEMKWDGTLDMQAMMN